MSDWKSGLKSIGEKGKSLGERGKGQVKGFIGRGDKSTSNSDNHEARPISELRDPNSFGPPPKRDTGLSQHQHDQPTAPHAPARFKPAPPPPPRGGGLELSAPEVPVRPLSARGGGGAGWQLDTTGLSTGNLPRPPARSGSGVLPPPGAFASGAAKGGGPAVPPRLPPRSATGSPVGAIRPKTAGAAAPQPGGGGGGAAGGLLNQGALSRLGVSGISVPGFGIGGSSAAAAPAAPPRRSSPGTPQSATSSSSNGVAALGQRFGASASAAAAAAASAIGKKKPAPPPPRKKAELCAPPPLPTRDDTPPPIPMSTRPTF